jgi:hypothetical protein
MAQAQTPETPHFDNATMGRFEGMLAFCEKADPPSAEKFKKIAELLTKDLTEDSLKQTRTSKEYLDSLDETKKQLKKLTPEEGAQQCKASVGDK